jgi:predicted extracellular nuclease
VLAAALVGCGGDEVPIGRVQGHGAVSPLAGRTVVVRGVVTAVLEDGAFFVQSERPDRSSRTSEGLLVRGGRAQVGDLVRVRGEVREEQRRREELPVTVLGARALAEQELASDLADEAVADDEAVAAGEAATDGGQPGGSAVEVVARGRPLPAAAPAPSPAELADPRRAIAAWEALEGMLVRLPPTTVIGPVSRFGELAVLPGGAGANAVSTVRGGLLDDDPERPRGEPILLDDELAELGLLAEAAVGDRLEQPLEGILDYRFGSYRLYPLETPPAAVRQERETDAVLPAGEGELSVASLNVENLDLGDPPARFRELGTFVVERLASPDLLLLQEVQDDSGPSDDGQTSSDATLRRLSAAVVDAGGPAYSYRYVRPRDGEDGGEPGGNIRTVLLARRDRGIRWVDRPPSSAHGGREPVATVELVGGEVVLGPSPARIAPEHRAFRESRKPLAVELRVADRTLWLLGVHLASKSGDDPVLGSFRPPRRRSSFQRAAQAAEIAALSRAILDLDGEAWILALGDFNDGIGSPALVELERAGLRDLVHEVPRPERYTFVYQGRSQLLDHVLASPALARCCEARVRILRGNADEPAGTRVSDHDPVVALFRIAGGGAAR